MILGAALVSAPEAQAQATNGGQALRISPENMQWQKWGSTQRTVLYGDPGDFSCPYVDRIKFPAGYKVDAHSFQQDKQFTVISGVVLVGIGRTWNDSQLQRMPAGSFWRIPAGVSYFFGTEGEAIMQTSTGAVPGKDCSPSPDDKQ